jgi:hypothetical protein
MCAGIRKSNYGRSSSEYLRRRYAVLSSLRAGNQAVVGDRVGSLWVSHESRTQRLSVDGKWRNWAASADLLAAMSRRIVDRVVYPYAFPLTCPFIDSFLQYVQCIATLEQQD